MKFGQYFEFGKVDDWRAAYLPYEELVQAIGNAVRHVKSGASPSGAYLPGRTRQQLVEEETASLLALLRDHAGQLNDFYQSRLRDFASEHKALMERARGEENVPSPLLEVGAARLSKRPVSPSADAGASESRRAQTELRRPLLEDAEDADEEDSAAVAGEALGEDPSSRKPWATASARASGAGAASGASSSTHHLSPRMRTEMRNIRRQYLRLYACLSKLRGFCSLNLTAIRKVASKFDKAMAALGSPTSLSDATVRTVSRLPFVSSTGLLELMSQVEQNFARLFHRNDVKHAVAALQRSGKTKVPMFDTFYLGLNVGLTLALALAVFVVNHVGVLRWHEQIMAVFPVYRAAICLILMIWLWGVLVYVFKRTEINYRYIFDFNPHDSLEFYQILKLAAALTSVVMLSFFLYWSALHNFDGEFAEIPGRVYVIAVLVLCLLFLLNPFDCLHRSSRKMLYRTILEVMISPFSRVRFVHVFVGDVLTSMVHPIADLQYTVCFYASGTYKESVPDLDLCRSVNAVVLPIVCALPYVWRLMQCLRRYYETKQAHPHLSNAGKYFSAVLVTVFGLLHSDFSSGNTWDAGRVAWLILFIVSVLYQYAWDVFMDWGLEPLNPAVRNYMLRDTLLFPYRWTYYFAMVSNFFARVVWAFTITPTSILTNKDANNVLVLALSVVEIVRRVQWSFFRVEWEFISQQQKQRSRVALTASGLGESSANLLGRSGSRRSISVAAASSVSPKEPGQGVAGAAGGPADLKRDPPNKRLRSNADEDDEIVSAPSLVPARGMLGDEAATPAARVFQL